MPDLHPDELAAARAAREAHDAADPLASEPDAPADDDAKAFERQVRHEARMLATRMPSLWGLLDQQTVPLAAPPALQAPGMALTSGEMMAYRMGQRSVVEWIARTASEPEPEEDGDEGQ